MVFLFLKSNDPLEEQIISFNYKNMLPMFKPLPIKRKLANVDNAIHVNSIIRLPLYITLFNKNKKMIYQFAKNKSTKKPCTQYGTKLSLFFRCHFFPFTINIASPKLKNRYFSLTASS